MKGGDHDTISSWYWSHDVVLRRPTFCPSPQLDVELTLFEVWGQISCQLYNCFKEDFYTSQIWTHWHLPLRWACQWLRKSQLETWENKTTLDDLDQTYSQSQAFNVWRPVVCQPVKCCDLRHKQPLRCVKDTGGASALDHDQNHRRDIFWEHMVRIYSLRASYACSWACCTLSWVTAAQRPCSVKLLRLLHLYLFHVLLYERFSHVTFGTLCLIVLLNVSHVNWKSNFYIRHIGSCVVILTEH